MPDREPSELRRLRDALKWTQNKMARKLDILERTYIRYELGTTRKVPAEVMDRARALKPDDEE